MKARDVSIDFVKSDGTKENVEFRVRDGLGAYEAWKEQPGNEGKTEAEYIESLRGMKGEAVVSLDTEVTEVDTTPVEG